jgi:hypothetical protein
LSAKPIPPKTVAKLALAERCLLDMRNASESNEAFRRHVASFLTAARSVKDVLINEIAAGDKAVKKRIKPPIEAAMNADSEMDSLVTTRNADIHDGDFTLAIEWLPEGFPRSVGDPGLNDFWLRHRARRTRVQQVHRSRMVGGPQAVEQTPRAFFDGIPDRDAYAVCAGHLEKVKTAAYACVQLYG